MEMKVPSDLARIIDKYLRYLQQKGEESGKKISRNDLLVQVMEQFFRNPHLFPEEPLDFEKRSERE